LSFVLGGPEKFILKLNLYLRKKTKETMRRFERDILSKYRLIMEFRFSR